MKWIVTMVLLSALTQVFAAEVSTDCPAMNQSREKNLKTVTTDVKTNEQVKTVSQ